MSKYIDIEKELKFVSDRIAENIGDADIAKGWLAIQAYLMSMNEDDGFKGENVISVEAVARNLEKIGIWTNDWEREIRSWKNE